jgi:hypothetical protein
MSLVIFGAIGLYLLLSIVVVALTVRYAKKEGRSATLWGCGAFLLMYLIPFWDWIPTVVTHRYYCSKEAGFWVYKTVERWKSENPGEMDKFVAYEHVPSSRPGDTSDFVVTYTLHQRIDLVSRKTGPLPVNRWRWEQTVVDRKNNEVLARSIQFFSGNGKVGGEIPLKFWLQSGGCAGGSAIEDAQFHRYYLQFLGKRQ